MEPMVRMLHPHPRTRRRNGAEFRKTSKLLASNSSTACSHHFPVRPVVTRAPKSTKGKGQSAAASETSSSAALGPTSERSAGGRGTLILIDQSPEEPGSFIEEDVSPAPPANGPDRALTLLWMRTRQKGTHPLPLYVSFSRSTLALH